MDLFQKKFLFIIFFNLQIFKFKISFKIILKFFFNFYFQKKI
jgi:hypothetical protein